MVQQTESHELKGTDVISGYERLALIENLVRARETLIGITNERHPLSPHNPYIRGARYTQPGGVLFLETANLWDDNNDENWGDLTYTILWLPSEGTKPIVVKMFHTTKDTNKLGNVGVGLFKWDPNSFPDCNEEIELESPIKHSIQEITRVILNTSPQCYYPEGIDIIETHITHRELTKAQEAEAQESEVWQDNNYIE